MIIDSHCHLVDRGWVHEDFFAGLARMIDGRLKAAGGPGVDPASITEGLWQALSDPTGDALVARMDSAGVDKTCVFCLDFGLATGEPGVPIEEQNRLIAGAARRHTDRLIPFFSIDPRRQGSLEMFRRGVEEMGMKGLKLHPAAGFYPYEEEVFSLCEACAGYGIPVLFHTGSQPAPMRFRFARPVYVDDVASEFPDLPVILAHVGHAWWEEALMVGSTKPNVRFDFSGWQLTYSSEPELFYGMLRRALDEVGAERVFFGTDGPYLEAACPVDRWLEAIRKPSAVDADVFTPAEKDAMLGDAFARLIGL